MLKTYNCPHFLGFSFRPGSVPDSSGLRPGSVRAPSGLRPGLVPAVLWSRLMCRKRATVVVFGVWAVWEPIWVSSRTCLRLVWRMLAAWSEEGERILEKC